MSDRPIRRVSVVGSSGAGKSTFAAKLARRLGVPYIELDAINWGPNWTPLDPETLGARVREATAADRWVCDGNYKALQPIILARADTLVWLDLPLRVCLARTLRRTARRVRSREELWAGNRESWRQALVGRDALVWYLLSQYQRKRRESAARIASADTTSLRVHRFRSSAEAESWLRSLPDPPKPSGPTQLG